MTRAMTYATVAGLALLLAGCSRPSRSGESAATSSAVSGMASAAPPKTVVLQGQQELSRRKVRGTPFSLVVPAGFLPAVRFDGFSGPDESTTIMITGLPVPPDKLSDMWRPDKLRSQGMSLVKKDHVHVAGITAELALVTQHFTGGDFEKWILVFPTHNQTFLCVAAYPRNQADALRAKLRDSLLSASYDPSAPADSVSPFQIDVTGLKLAHRISKTEMYTLDGRAQKSSPSAPVLLVGPSVAKVAPSDRQAYAEQRLRQTAHTKIAEVAPHSALMVDALPGYESIATGTDSASGAAMTAYQVMLFADDHYFIIQGLVGRDQASVYLPQFKRAARTFRRNPQE
jgi:hypothetical protein